MVSSSLFSDSCGRKISQKSALFHFFSRVYLSQRHYGRLLVNSVQFPEPAFLSSPDQARLEKTLQNDLMMEACQSSISFFASCLFICLRDMTGVYTATNSHGLIRYNSAAAFGLGVRSPDRLPGRSLPGTFNRSKLPA